MASTPERAMRLDSRLCGNDGRTPGLALSQAVFLTTQTPIKKPTKAAIGRSSVTQTHSWLEAIFYASIVHFALRQTLIPFTERGQHG
jgi:hypothetical protein